MFNTSKKNPDLLDAEITRLFEELKDHPAESKEYANTVDQLIKLIKTQEEKNTKRRVSPDTLAIVGANLLGIGMILSYEKVNVIATKAIGFVMRAR